MGGSSATARHAPVFVSDEVEMKSFALTTVEEAEVECSSEEPLPRPASPPPPPDGGYGWVCVLSQFLINCFTWGVIAVSLQNRPIKPRSSPLSIGDDFPCIGNKACLANLVTTRRATASI